MSFGPSQSVKNDQNMLAGQTATANANSAKLNDLGGTNLATGSGNVSSGTNFWNTLLNGNQANTTALLAPNIQANRDQTQQNLQSVSTLMPRGGGRSGTLFGTAMAPTTSLQNLFNSGRTTAAQTLPQIGLAQQGIGTNLFGAGNQALNTGVGATGTNLDSALKAQEMSNTLAGGIGSFATGLLTAPGNNGSLFSKIIGCWIAEAIYGTNDVRTHVLRAYLNGPFRKTLKGALIMRAYLAVGRQVAWVARRSSWLRNMLRPAFESALANCRSTFVEVS